MLLNSRIFVILLILASMLAGFPVSATDDAYLKMLESEAENVQLDNGSQLKQENNRQSAIATFDWDGAVEKEGLPTGLGQEALEAFLHKYYFGTYVFFKKLNSADKNTVYYRYSKDDTPSIDNVRQNVMTLLKQ